MKLTAKSSDRERRNEFSSVGEMSACGCCSAQRTSNELSAIWDVQPASFAQGNPNALPGICEPAMVLGCNVGLLANCIQPKPMVCWLKKQSFAEVHAASQVSFTEA